MLVMMERGGALFGVGSHSMTKTDGRTCKQSTILVNGPLQGSNCTVPGTKPGGI